jgi:hypothetical protein
MVGKGGYPFFMSVEESSCSMAKHERFLPSAYRTIAMLIQQFRDITFASIVPVS